MLLLQVQQPRDRNIDDTYIAIAAGRDRAAIEHLKIELHDQDDDNIVNMLL